MLNIKPISELSKDSEELRDASIFQLMNELAKGRKSGEEKGWLTMEAVEKYLGIENK